MKGNTNCNLKLIPVKNIRVLEFVKNKTRYMLEGLTAF